jgi:hypothetical protein
MFTEEERGRLARVGTRMQFVCSPILDVGVDLSVWRCFPFSCDESIKLTDFDRLDSIIQHYEKRWKADTVRGSLPQCPECANMRRGTCAGGCLSRTVSKAV